MSYSDLLIHVCDISRHTSNSIDDYGNPVLTWSTIYTTEPCRLVPTGGREITVDKQVVVSDWLLHLKPTVTVTERDRVVIDLATYEIVLVQIRNATTAAHHVEASLLKVY
jgi:hypothetical protein